MGLLKKDAREERLKTTLCFLIKLLVLALPLYLIIWFSVDLYPLKMAAATELEFVLKNIGYNVIREGSMLTVSGGSSEEPFTFFIVDDCTAWKSMIFLFALMVAVPSIRWKRRSVGLIIGIPVLWFGNLVRNVSVVLIERAYGVEIAMLIHDWLWKAGLIFMVLSIWLVWWSWARKEERGILSRLGKSKVWKSITRWDS